MCRCLLLKDPLLLGFNGQPTRLIEICYFGMLKLVIRLYSCPYNLKDILSLKYELGTSFFLFSFLTLGFNSQREILILLFSVSKNLRDIPN